MPFWGLLHSWCLGFERLSIIRSEEFDVYQEEGGIWTKLYTCMHFKASVEPATSTW